MTKIKKIIAIMCAFVLITGLCVVNVNATYQEGNQVLINTDAPVFRELMFVEDGKTYIPLRLAFPSLNDQENKFGMTIFWDAENAKIRLRCGETTGEDLVEYPNGDIEPPFNGERTCLDIYLLGNAVTGATTEMVAISYDGVDVNGLPVNTHDYRDFAEGDVDGLLNRVYIKSVGDGVGRVFVATEDVVKIAKLLGINDNYSVKLYTWVEDGGQQ